MTGSSALSSSPRVRSPPARRVWRNANPTNHSGQPVDGYQCRRLVRLRRAEDLQDVAAAAAGPGRRAGPTARPSRRRRAAASAGRTRSSATGRPPRARASPRITGSVRTPSAPSASILSMCLPNRTLVTSSAYGIEVSRTHQSTVPVAARNVPPTISGPQTRNTPGSPEAVVLEPDRRRDVEDRHEQAGQREGDDERPALGGEEQHDRGADEVDREDGDLRAGAWSPSRTGSGAARTAPGRSPRCRRRRSCRSSR